MTAPIPDEGFGIYVAAGEPDKNGQRIFTVDENHLVYLAKGQDHLSQEDTEKVFQVVGEAVGAKLREWQAFSPKQALGSALPTNG